jgi:hypothetical protein
MQVKDIGLAGFFERVNGLSEIYRFWTEVVYDQRQGWFWTTVFSTQSAPGSGKTFVNAYLGDCQGLKLMDKE